MTTAARSSATCCGGDALEIWRHASLEAEPEATSLSHFLAQSPPSSPAARAFRTFTPSPKDGNAPGGRPVLPLAPSPPPAERVVIRA